MGFYEDSEKLYSDSGGSLRQTDELLYLAAQDGNHTEINRLTYEAGQEFIRDTNEGQRLTEWADGNSEKITAVLTRLQGVLVQRHGENAIGYIFRYQEIARDLLNAGEFRVGPKTFSPPPTPEPTESEQIEDLIPEVAADVGDPMRGIAGRLSTVEIKARCDRDRFYRAAFQQFMQDDVHGTRQETRTDLPNSEIKRFGHLLRDHLLKHGVPKPAGGFYTIKAGDKEYRYPVREFERLSEVAAQFNLF